MMYLLPYMLAEVAGQGGDELQLIIQELTAVMQVCTIKSTCIWLYSEPNCTSVCILKGVSSSQARDA